MKYAFMYQTSIGNIIISEDSEQIDSLCFGDFLKPGYEYAETKLIKEAFKQISEYLCGERKEFTLPIKLNGTIFQNSVWKAVMSIPYGETRSYKEVAEAVGNPKASRAVGSANNKNPLLIIVPCHRVVGSDGKCLGYAAGLEIKNRLLNIEQSRGALCQKKARIFRK